MSFDLWAVAFSCYVLFPHVTVCGIDDREARCWLLNSFQMFLKPCWYLGSEYGNALVESE
jgi:hypothetical protein